MSSKTLHPSHIVGANDHRDRWLLGYLLRLCAKPLRYHALVRGVLKAHWFVEQPERCILRGDCRQTHALALSTRELGNRSV